MLGGLGTFAASPALAAYPERPITLLHGFAPGGSADALARVLAASLGSLLGQATLVEPRPGAGGMVGSATLSRAAPDGHTLGLITGGHAVAAAFGQNITFDPVDGFTWISRVVEFGFVIAVRADHPARDLRSLLQMAGRPGGLTFGSAGVGSTHHLAGELLAAMSGVPLVHVPYRGEANAITGVMSGDLSFAIITTVTAGPQLQAGRLRALAVTAPEPVAAFPNVPPAAETVPNYAVTTWAGLAGPANLPGPVRQRLHQAVLTVAEQPEHRNRLAALVDGRVRTSTGDELRSLVASEISRWRELIGSRNLQTG
ncbi:MAG TPA: tripartite tricarboxylate transporter substrate binding protein [Roseococcus sp.]|nr:tripartite tricarboxylate transporter substrate binding protein [Roseococcus sp.]